MGYPWRGIEQLPANRMATHNGDTLREGVVNGLALDGLLLVFALTLVALNGLFVAAEFALVKIRATQVDRLVVEGKTSAGLALGQLGRAPEVGDEVHLHGHRLRVEEANGPRVARVSVKKEPG